MNIDDTTLLNALRTIINEEISKRIEEENSFDIYEHRQEIEDFIQDYIENNMKVEVSF